MKSAFVPIKETKAHITSAVPLLFRLSAALVGAVSGGPGAAYWNFGALLGGDISSGRLLPRTKTAAL